MKGKSDSVLKACLRAPDGGLAALMRHGLQLHERQHRWEQWLPLAAQGQTHVLSWSDGVLRVLCGSPAWAQFLKRELKTVLGRWHETWPEDRVERMETLVRPFAPLPPPPAYPRVLRAADATAVAALRAAAEKAEPPLAAALERLGDTLTQAGTALSTKEKGTFDSG